MVACLPSARAGEEGDRGEKGAGIDSVCFFRVSRKSMKDVRESYEIRVLYWYMCRAIMSVVIVSGIPNCIYVVRDESC